MVRGDKVAMRPQSSWAEFFGFEKYIPVFEVQEIYSNDYKAYYKDGENNVWSLQLRDGGGPYPPRREQCIRRESMTADEVERVYIQMELS